MLSLSVILQLVAGLTTTHADELWYGQNQDGHQEDVILRNREPWHQPEFYGSPPSSALNPYSSDVSDDYGSSANSEVIETPPQRRIGESNIRVHLEQNVRVRMSPPVFQPWYRPVSPNSVQPPLDTMEATTIVPGNPEDRDYQSGSLMPNAGSSGADNFKGNRWPIHRTTTDATVEVLPAEDTTIVATVPASDDSEDDWSTRRVDDGSVFGQDMVDENPVGANEFDQRTRPRIQCQYYRDKIARCKVINRCDKPIKILQRYYANAKSIQDYSCTGKVVDVPYDAGNGLANKKIEGMIASGQDLPFLLFVCEFVEQRGATGSMEKSRKFTCREPLDCSRSEGPQSCSGGIPWDGKWDGGSPQDLSGTVMNEAMENA